MSPDPIPVTVLSGSLGAGKTTLVNHLLANAGDRDLAVLVNDMGEVNVDAELVAEGSELDLESETESEGENETGRGRPTDARDGVRSATREPVSVAELSNGCICCELQDDLETAVVRLARDREFDHLLVEASGISEPGPVARLFTTTSRVAARYEIDALVTVLDTRYFLDSFAGESIPERRGPAETDENRPLSDLLIEQVEVANLVLLNKADRCEPSELERAEELVRALQPGLETIRTEFSAVDPDRLLGVESFDPGQLGELAGWQRVLAEDGASGASFEDGVDHGDGGGSDHDSGADHEHEYESGADNDHEHDHEHRHPDEVYGVTSFVFRARRPFHPERFASFLRTLPENVVRSKGTAWVAGREVTLEVSQAGPSVRVTVRGPWIAALPELDRQLYRSNRPGLEWDDDHGDRRTELVVIGTDLEEPALRERLRECLVTDSEWDRDGSEENPFPSEHDDTWVLRES